MLGTSVARLIELAVVLFYAFKMNREVKLRISDIFVRDKVLFGDFINILSL